MLRAENEWPLARTQWTKYFLQPDGLGLGTAAPKDATTLRYETTGDGLTFCTPPSDKSLEITGPVAAKLWVSSETTDADLFLVLRLFDPAGKEVTFIGSNDPRTPVGLGWLRASQRKLDPKKSLPYRPWHPHDEEWPLKPGEPVELDIEIWPTCIVVPPGYRLALTVRGKDYEVDGTDAALPNAPYPMKGVGPFLHIDPDDRPAAHFRLPQHAALCRRQGAIPLVAGHSRGVSFRRKQQQGRSNNENDPCRRAGSGRFGFGRTGSRATPIRTAPSPSSCPIRPAGRPMRLRA